MLQKFLQNLTIRQFCLKWPLIIMVTLLLSEMGFRLIATGRLNLGKSVFNGYLHLRSYHPTRGWGFTPLLNLNNFTTEYSSHIAINSQGFRDDEFKLNSTDPKQLKIAIVGDSFVSAIQVDKEKRFGELLEKITCNHQSIEVMNFGIGGYGTYQEYLLLDEVKKYRPDLIILSYYENDLTDNSLELEKLIKSGHNLKIIARPFIDAPLAISKEDVEMRLARSQAKVDQPLSLLFHRLASPWKKTSNDENNSAYYISALESQNLEINNKRAKALAQTFEILKLFVEKSQKTPTVLLLAPASWEVTPLLQKKIEQKFPNEKFDFTRHQQEIKKMAESLMLPVIDPYPLFKESVKNGQMNHYYEGHWNESGHQLIVSAISQYLKCR